MATAKQVEFLLAGVINDDGSDTPLAGGQVFTYEAGTTSPKSTWTDANKGALHTNPIILDNQGTAAVYADGNYKFVIKRATGETVYTRDNLNYIISTTTNVTTISSSNYTALESDDLILCNCNLNNINIALPAASSLQGHEYTIKKIDSTANTVTINPNGAETIDGESSYTLSSQYQVIQIRSDGTNWYLMATDETPIGTVKVWSGSVDSPPSRWFVCNGNAISRTTYAQLFTIVGTTYGVGDTSTTFNIPNCTDRFVAHADADTSGTIDRGDTGGTNSVTLDTSTLPSHSHGSSSLSISGGTVAGTTGSDGSHAHDLDMWESGATTPNRKVVQRAAYQAIEFSTDSAGAHTHTFSGSLSGASVSGNTDSAGTGSNLDIQNKYLAMPYIIKVQ